RRRDPGEAGEGREIENCPRRPPEQRRESDEGERASCEAGRAQPGRKTRGRAGERGAPDENAKRQRERLAARQEGEIMQRPRESRTAGRRRPPERQEQERGEQQKARRHDTSGERDHRHRARPISSAGEITEAADEDEQSNRREAVEEAERLGL